MNLILLFSLLLAWLITMGGPSILDRVQTIESLLLQSDPDSRSPGVAQFLSETSRASSASGLQSVRLEVLSLVDPADIRGLKFSSLIAGGAGNKPEMRRAIDHTYVEVPAGQGRTSLVLPQRVIENELAELRRLRLVTKLPETPTLAHLEALTTPELEIPFVERTVSSRSAYWVLGIAVLAPMLLLLSHAQSLALMASRAPLQEALDWLPLHPGALPQVLAAVWIGAPAALLTIGGLLLGDRFLVGVRDHLAAAILVLILGILAAAILQRAQQIRALTTATAAAK